MSRHVNWSDSPTGGSHRRNDSGVGPFSDSDDRSRKSSNEYDDPYTVDRLTERLVEVTKQKEKYKKKAEELDLDLMRVKLDFAQTKKELGEKEAQCAALKNSNEVLASDKQGLVERTKQQQDEISRLEDKLRRANRKSGSPPTSMSGAIPPETTDDKMPRRATSQRKPTARRGSMSQKDYDRAVRHQLRADEEERQRQEREQEERLRRRMGNNPGDESDANNSNNSRGSKTSKGSHTSYIEPLGPKEPRPQVPHSPRESRPPPAAQYPGYSTTQYAQPTFTTMAREPVSSNVSRSIRPQVFYSEGGDDYQQPGSYKPYPLPRR